MGEKAVWKVLRDLDDEELYKRVVLYAAYHSKSVIGEALAYYS